MTKVQTTISEKVMVRKWRWDQGRLDYFLFDNIKALAIALLDLDGVKFDDDPLRAFLTERTELQFKPLDYTVWRNYKRVFECALLATKIDERLYVSDLCRAIAGGEYQMEADEYLSLHLPRFRYPFPAFAEQLGGEKPVYPFPAILKFLLSRLSEQERSGISPDDVVAYLVGNGVTGFEESSFYDNLKPGGYVASGDELRQIREMLIFMSQLSALKWHQGRLMLDVTLADTPVLQSMRELANPVYVLPRPIRAEDFMAITALTERKYTPLAIPSRETTTDLTFTEGKRSRVTHIKIERSPLLRQFFLQKYPEPVCDMCRANMQHRYPWTRHLIEIHHLLPLSSTLTVRSGGTSLDDVVGLCPNCHRSIHSFYKLWLDTNQLNDFRTTGEARAIYADAKQSIVL